MLKIINNNDEFVVLENLAKSPLEVAMHPYLSADWKYITVSKGKDNTFTITKEDGTTFSFYHGSSGHTLVSKNLDMLREKICRKLETEGIVYKIPTTKSPNSARIFFNDGCKKWQSVLSVTGYDEEQYYWSSTANNEQEVLEEIRVFNPNFKSLKKKIAQTGIDIWDVVEEIK